MKDYIDQEYLEYNPLCFCVYYIRNNNKIAKMHNSCKFFDEESGKSYYLKIQDEPHQLILLDTDIGNTNIGNTDINGYIIYNPISNNNKFYSKLCYDYTFFINTDILVSIKDETKCDLIIFSQQHSDYIPLEGCNFDNSCSKNNCKNSKKIYKKLNNFLGI